MKRLLRAGGVFLVAVVMMLLGLFADKAPEGAKQTYDPGTYEVLRVVDGDTINILYKGEERAVRLIGLDAPERDECYGQGAKVALERLLGSQNVLLEPDPTQDAVDTYGRLLAYVYLPDGTFINELLIRQGHAREYTHIYPYQHQSAFQSAESEARQSHLGLWSTCI